MPAQCQIWVPDTDPSGVKVSVGLAGAEVTLKTIAPGEQAQFTVPDEAQLRITPLPPKETTP